MLMSTDTIQTIGELRAKVVAGTITDQELQYAISVMRKARGAAASASPAKSRTAKQPVDTGKLMDELDNL